MGEQQNQTRRVQVYSNIETQSAVAWRLVGEVPECGRCSVWRYRGGVCDPGSIFTIIVWRSSEEASRICYSSNGDDNGDDNHALDCCVVLCTLHRQTPLMVVVVVVIPA